MNFVERLKRCVFCWAIFRLICSLRTTLNNNVSFYWDNNFQSRYSRFRSYPPKTSPLLNNSRDYIHLFPIKWRQVMKTSEYLYFYLYEGWSDFHIYKKLYKDSTKNPSHKHYSIAIHPVIYQSLSIVGAFKALSKFNSELKIGVLIINK